MKNLPTIPVQKWKLSMYIFIFVVILMNFLISVDNIALYLYLQSLTSNYNQEKILFGSIYFIYLFFHLMIIIGAKKSNSKVLYIVLAYWIIDVIWLIASIFPWFSLCLPMPITKFRRAVIGKCLWTINTFYFTDSNENFIRLQSGPVIFRQDRIRFYTDIIFIVITILSIKRKKTDV